jgi:hypothetical protein
MIPAKYKSLMTVINTVKSDCTLIGRHAPPYQSELRMKKSCIKMQPNGRTPPITIPGTGSV